MNLILSVYQHLNARRRVQLLLVMLLMLVGAFAEAFTLGAVVPFLGLLVNPEVLDQQPMVAATLDTIGQWLGGSRLRGASVVFAVVALLAGVLRLVLSWATFKFVLAVGADFGESIYNRSLQQPYSYHLQRNSSETLASIEKVSTLVLGVMLPFMGIVTAGVMAVAIFGAMLWVNPTVALVAGVVFGGMYLGISWWAKRRLRANGQVIADTGTEKLKAMQEGLGAIRDVIIDGNHAVYVRQFARADRAQRHAQAMNAVLASSPKYVVESIGMVMFAALAYWMATQPGGVAVAVPTLGALALGAQRLLPYAQNMYNYLASIRGSMASAQDSLELLNLPLPEPQQPVPPRSQANLAGALPALVLKDVRFAYTADGPQVLNGLNLTVCSGQRVGFVGSTGSGKSTLIDLIMGLVTPTAGELRVEGERVTQGNLRLWQSRIAHVPQAIFLSDSSIAENIALGAAPHEIDQGRLRRAMEQAQLAEFVDQLPQGVQTRVGERGVQLSGGQRQRIGIARALYKDADVLVLDEATSALDNDTEAKVMQAIYQLRPNMIVLMIAHRLSSLAQCDVVYEIRKGEAFVSTASVQVP
ncbi:MAG: ABC transporter ATP-binding protein [Hydrogenophaga sp.]